MSLRMYERMYAIFPTMISFDFIVIIMVFHPLLLFTILSLALIRLSKTEVGDPYSWISKVQTLCEVEALQVGSLLGDHYNSFDEGTEWDMRIHGDYMTEHLGFAGWIQTGVWKSGGITNEKHNAVELHKVII